MNLKSEKHENTDLNFPIRSFFLKKIVCAASLLCAAAVLMFFRPEVLYPDIPERIEHVIIKLSKLIRFLASITTWCFEAYGLQVDRRNLRRPHKTKITYKMLWIPSLTCCLLLTH